MGIFIQYTFGIFYKILLILGLIICMRTRYQQVSKQERQKKYQFPHRCKSPPFLFPPEAKYPVVHKVSGEWYIVQVPGKRGRIGRTHMAEKKGFFGEFKQFITKGNVMDMAVGVIIGGAFTAIVNSLVKDILTPIIGIFLGGVNFSGLKVVIRPAQGDIPEAAITYGNFIQAIINFLLIALVVFIMVKQVNKAREAAKKAKEAEEAAAKPVTPPAPPAPSKEELLLAEIRDLLKKQQG